MKPESKQKQLQALRDIFPSTKSAGVAMGYADGSALSRMLDGSRPVNQRALPLAHLAAQKENPDKYDKLMQKWAGE